MDYLSTFRVPIDKIPQAKNWKVGGKYQILANVEQTAISKERDYSSMDLEVERPRKKKEKPRYKTMVEFKVTDVSATPKDKALKSKIND
jgi:hypothetical protein